MERHRIATQMRLYICTGNTHIYVCIYTYIHYNRGIAKAKTADNRNIIMWEHNTVLLLSEHEVAQPITV